MIHTNTSQSSVVVVCLVYDRAQHITTKASVISLKKKYPGSIPPCYFRRSTDYPSRDQQLIVTINRETTNKTLIHLNNHDE